MPDLQVFFRKSADYKIIPVSGIFGGVTPQGFIMGDLFLERAEAPESVILRINEATGEADEVSRNPKTQHFIRESIVGIAMQPEVARSIGQWLISKADEYEKGQIRKR